MKIKLANGKVLKFRVENDPVEGPCLVVREKGRKRTESPWYVLSICSDGTLGKFTDLSAELGLKLDGRGRIQTHDDE